jgi:hypothetical protein
MGNCGATEPSPQEVVQCDFIEKRLTSGSHLSVIQSHDLYQYYKQIMLQVERYLHSHPHEKCPFVVNIHQANKIKSMKTIGFYQGDFCVILFIDNMLCVMFEHSNSDYHTSFRVLEQWRRHTDGKLRLTTIEATGDFRGIFWVTSASLLRVGEK